MIASCSEPWVLRSNGQIRCNGEMTSIDPSTLGQSVALTQEQYYVLAEWTIGIIAIAFVLRVIKKRINPRV